MSVLGPHQGLMDAMVNLSYRLRKCPSIYILQRKVLKHLTPKTTEIFFIAGIFIIGDYAG